MACGTHYFMVNRRGKVKVVTDFLLGSRITATVTAAMKSEDDCFLAELTNLDSVLQSRDTTLMTNVRIIVTAVFPVVVYGCKSWTVKAEHQRFDAFGCGAGNDS